ncbi:MAG: TPM domain-containing protein [Candidatus Gracilibacteria bacterium]|nr:TPM domain-containing protein [Candidatus Gracilibacteria bacterium]
MKKIIIKILFFFVLFSCFFQARSFDISSLGNINSYVVDKVGVLNDTEKQNIESKIQEIRDKYTTEILLVIIPTTDNEDISQVATEIGQEIGVGKKDKDNGLVVLIAIDDRSWNIATGYGVEGVLPDILTKKIGEKNFVLFKDKRYFDGIMGSLYDFEKAFSGDPSIISDLQDSPDETPTLWIIELIFVFIFSSTVLKVLANKEKYKQLFIITSIAFIVTLPFTYTLIKDFIVSVFVNIIIWVVVGIFGIFGNLGKGIYNSKGGLGGKSSGGGFGGFGGGGFGGGGSSGKW